MERKGLGELSSNPIKIGRKLRRTMVITTISTKTQEMRIPKTRNFKKRRGKKDSGRKISGEKNKKEAVDNLIGNKNTIGIKLKCSEGSLMCRYLPTYSLV